MSEWIRADEQMPPLDEEVVVLYKRKEKEFEETPDNLHYAIAYRFKDEDGFIRWSNYFEYQCYYDVVYWARLYEKPTLKSGGNQG